MPINKIVYGTNILIDLTGDTVDASSLLQGKTAHAKDGSIIEGTMEPNPLIGYPESVTYVESIEDEDGNPLIDENQVAIQGRIMYSCL